jgi:uncharacterized protein (DUF2249 family)
MIIPQHHKRLNMGIDTADDKIQELDCRDISGNPFREILATLDTLPKDETLVLIADHEPKPFYSKLKEHGYTYETSHTSEEEWRVVVAER